jgi:hypothetical protein
MDEKYKGYSLTFLLFFAPIRKMKKVAERKWTQSKGYCLTFFLFCPCMKNEKSR